MKKIVLILLCFFISVSPVLCQSSRADGISLRNISTNRNDFNYGEPLSFAFELKNETPTLKKYWRKATGVNLYYRLIDLKSNKEVGNSIYDWRSFSPIRDNFSSNIPNENASFQPNLAYFFIVDISSDLYSPLFNFYDQNLKYKNVLSLDLTSLPEGDYKLMVEFHLLLA